MSDKRWTLHRWTLNRGGIVNVWQYAEQVFDFSGGRAIFQGTNGSGKSRTLELLLPLCLDGDLRQLGSKGFDTVSIRRLMLDDYDGGPNRIGYAWIELRRENDSGGEDEYLTCGLGVKASKTSQQITDSWRFVTSARVGKDLRLAGPDRVPIGPAQLRDLIGADCMFEDAAFRAKVAETVYGVPAARYADLLHLQRTLRNPDVGLKVLEGQLEQILSDALPPLDSAMVEGLATSFDDLESIRENITRLTTADSALTAFLGTYSGYALASLRGFGDKVAASRKSLTALGAELESLQRKLGTARDGRVTAEQAVAEQEAQDSQLDARIEALKELPAYRGMRDLQDREQLVARSRSAAEAALDTASRQRAQEDRAVDSVLAVLRRLGLDIDSADELAGHARERLTIAGLDGDLCPKVPPMPPTDAQVTQDRVRAKPDPEAEPQTIDRRLLPAIDPQSLLDTLSDAGRQAEQVATEARRRNALTLSLHERALASDRQLRDVEELHRAARQAQLTATESAGRRNEAGQQLATAVDVWREQARRWAAEDGPQPPSAERLVEDRGAARAARDSVRQWASPKSHELRQRVVAAEQRLDNLRATITQYEAEVVALRSGGADEQSDPSAFHRLVDFVPTLPEVEQAGLEAALQASGLLTAKVSTTGRVSDAELAEVIALAGPAASGRTLADVLIPAAEPGCPVPADVVAKLLAAVGVADEPAGTQTPGLVLSTRGAWRAGVLCGSQTKPVAEFVGTGAREAARQRRLAELSSAVERLHSELADAERLCDSARADAAQWEQHVEAFPDDGELISAHAKLTNAKESAEESEERAYELRGEHQASDERWHAARAELVQAASEAGIGLGDTVDTEALDRANRAASEARGAAEQLAEALAGRCARTVIDLIDAMQHHHAALTDRTEAESAADALCVEYADRSHAMAELSSAIGGEAEEVARQLSTLDAERKAVRKQLPQSREKVVELREQATKLETLLETKRAQLTGREGDAAGAVAAFEQALAAPGVWSAAFPEVEAAADVDSALALIDGAADRKGSSEGTVIGKLQVLQTSLAGTHDIGAETAGGVLTVTVTGEDGPRPVADAALRVSQRLAEQRGFLGERYQSIFADYLIRDLAERLRGQIEVAEDLCRRMNDVLDQARSSQGVHVQLEWRPSAALDDRTKQALELVRTPLADRTSEQDDLLRQVITERIEAERDAHSSGYAEILARALDYRTWYSFTVRVRDSGPDGKPRVRRLRQLSSGETRLVSYVTLFAAAASFYDAVSSGGDEAPLRLVLLDEAFERLDDPTIARMLGLLVDLDMDWVITWPSGWGVSSKIPRMHIYDVLRPKNGRGVACTHTTWDGAGLDREDP
ncbi:TIGR02680 family protein [Kutzneria sp. CA-103260]|uniref:TIGR02680 family protein n=1 Tax=Kutzneria sp. CA-103260 TaxID=2802641 RepID=UPI001BF119D6|nr:TIGR02680 family protein [Kutzneria sp. CA-103260]QUQ68977.1 TIGR02680 family protein [Kutzneria sp. CA-103260]